MADVAAFDAASGGVRGFLHRPDGAAARRGGVVLTHGAGGNCGAALLVKACDAFAAAGFAALRCDLPFRQKRPKGPPAPSGAAADRAGLRAAVEALRAEAAGPIVLGGQSYGGRQATMLAAEEPGLVAALLLFSYPLHPPGRPERLRVEHFPKLAATPCVFVSGTSDPFGTPAELRAAIAAIPAPTEFIAIDGAGHDLKRGGFNLAQTVAAVLRQLPQ